jgi:hypothetical protein
MKKIVVLVFIIFILVYCGDKKDIVENKKSNDKL